MYQTCILLLNTYFKSSCCCAFQEQFEFALAAVAEEVHAILKALPQ